MGQIILKKSNEVDKIPSESGMSFGEIFVNYASGTGKSFLSTKKYDGSVAQFMEKEYNDDKYATKKDISDLISDILSIREELERINEVLNN